MIDKEILEKLTNNQARLIEALSANPEGLYSRELAAKTSISNKSAAVTPELKEFLAAHNLELCIEKHVGENCQALWTLRAVNPQKESENNDLNSHLAMAFEDMANSIRDSNITVPYLHGLINDCTNLLIDEIVHISRQ